MSFQVERWTKVQGDMIARFHSDEPDTLYVLRIWLREVRAGDYPIITMEQSTTTWQEQRHDYLSDWCSMAYTRMFNSPESKEIHETLILQHLSHVYWHYSVKTNLCFMQNPEIGESCSSWFVSSNLQSALILIYQKHWGNRVRNHVCLVKTRGLGHRTDNHPTGECHIAEVHGKWSL